MSALLTALCMWLGGLAVMLGAGPERARGRIELHATALAVGLALGPALFIAWLFVVGNTGVWVGRGLQLGMALSGLWALTRPRSRPRATLPPDPRGNALIEGGLTIVVFLLAGLALVYPLSQPLWGFDATYHFAQKGQLLLAEGLGSEGWTRLEGAVGRILTHPRYPPGLPALEALCGSWSGRFDVDAARPLFGVFAVLPAALLWAALAGRGRALAGAAACLWLSLPLLYYKQIPFLQSQPSFAITGFFLGPESAAERFPSSPPFPLPEGWILGGAADVPMAAMLLAAFLSLMRLFQGTPATRDRSDLLAAGVLVCGALLIKNEGLALVPVLLLALCIASLARRLLAPAPAQAGAPGNMRALAPALALAALLVSPWLIARAGLPVIDESYPARLAELPANPERFESSGRILRELQACFFPPFAPAPSSAYLAWPLLFLGLCYALARSTSRGSTGLVLGAGLFAGFLLSSRAPLEALPAPVFRWGLLWPLFFAVLARAAARPRELLAAREFPAGVAVLGAALLYWLILVATPWELDALFKTLIPDRLVLHITPLGILAALGLGWPERAPAPRAS